VFNPNCLFVRFVQTLINMKALNILSKFRVCLVFILIDVETYGSRRLNQSKYQNKKEERKKLKLLEQK